jgi:hypothetical protein
MGHLTGYLGRFPLGAGLGSGGPAAGQLPAHDRSGLDAENQFNFLVIELGIPGLLLLLSFNLRLLSLAARRIRAIDDGELRLLLAALTAPLFALLLGWTGGIATTGSAGAAYFWFAAGTLAYWVGGKRPEASTQALAPTRSRPATAQGALARV